MSRIGNKIITIPEGLNVTISEGLVDIKGKFGEDKIPFNKDFIILYMVLKSLSKACSEPTKINDINF